MIGIKYLRILTVILLPLIFLVRPLILIRSITVGIPNCRTPFPSVFGISTRRTGGGKYFPSRISCLILGHFCHMIISISLVVMPSMPGDPLLRTIALRASCWLRQSATLSIVASERYCWLSGRKDLFLSALPAHRAFQKGYEALPRFFCFRFGLLLISAIIRCHRSPDPSFVFSFGPSMFKIIKHLLCRLLTAVPFTSPLRGTASTDVFLFGRILIRREYSSHRVIRYIFLLTCRIYTNPSE